MSMIRRTAAAVLMVCLLLSQVFIECAAETRFPDISGHWAEKYVNELAIKGVISGMADGLFHPGLPVTTEQFVTMILASRFGKIDPTNDYWASGYLDFAYKNDLITDDELDHAKDPLMRRLAVRIAHDALLKLWDEADEADWSAAEQLADLYSCRTCVIHIAQLYTKGIIAGRSDGLFYGDDILTRAEAAVIIMKMLDTSLRNPQATTSFQGAPSDGAISPENVKKIMELDKTVLLIDVRSQEEHNSGYIPESYCVPLPELTENISATIIPSTAKDTVIIVYCQKGPRSASAFKILKEAGYNNVYNLGGIDDWPYEIIAEDN